MINNLKKHDIVMYITLVCMCTSAQLHTYMEQTELQHLSYNRQDQLGSLQHSTVRLWDRLVLADVQTPSHVTMLCNVYVTMKVLTRY